MSSDKDASVENLQLGGRGHKKQKPIVRKIREEHGTPILSLPKEIGLRLNQEVVIEKIGSNPLTWEIRIKPLEKKREDEALIVAVSKESQSGQ